MNKIFTDKVILITGGTGTIGMELAEQILKSEPKAVRILTNDENSLFHAMNKFSESNKFRYFLGSVVERERLNRAMTGADIVFHAAALKHVHICEYNPFEAVKTNVYGIQNVIDTAIDNNVEKVIFTSSDKAVNPSNVMGVSKLMGEKLITTANFFKGKNKTVFSTIRLGNVIGSRGSVVPLFKSQINSGGPITITDNNMSRYILTMDEAIDNILRVANISKGGEVFISKMRALNITTLAQSMIEELSSEDISLNVIGLKPGEKLFEELITEEEISRTVELDDFYVVLPQFTEFQDVNYSAYENNPIVKDVLRSDKADKMSKEEITTLLEAERML